MRTKAEREAVQKRLQEIEDAHGGRLTPADVVADARDLKSPLHRYFTWDVRKAAERYWLDEARELITSLKVVVRVERQQVSTIFYVKDPSCERGQQGYISYDRLRTESDLAREAIVNEFARAADMLRRARQLAKALELHNEVDKLVTDVVGLAKRVEAGATPSSQQ